MSFGSQLFDDSQLAEIHDASLKILRHTGVRVRFDEALELLRGAGCRVSDGDLVKFPAAVVDEALGSAPSSIVLHGRDGEPRVCLEGSRTFFGTGSDLPNILDLETGERRLSRLSDVADTARLADSLPNIDFVMSMALPSDVAPETSDRRSFLAMVENTSKPVVFTAWDETGLADIIAMAEEIAGSTAQMNVEGASAPVTSAGTLAMANAEVLSGITIAQLRRAGTPIVYGSGSGPLDMRTTVATYSSPEFMLHCRAIAELGQRLYHLPTWGFSGCTDSKVPDMQAGADAGLWTLWTTLCGANLVHDVGYVESGMTCSYEMIVLCDEIIGFVRRLMGGVEISPETLALETIDEVGPGGDYLTTEHTLRHYKECWYPQLFDRLSHPAWVEAGSPSIVEKARAAARKAVSEHVPDPLPVAILETLRALVAAADERAGIE
jgi:trimethylamine--corrinoid protein Co-methyltransferase